MKFVLKSPSGEYATGAQRWAGGRLAGLTTPDIGGAQVYTLAVRADGGAEVEPDPPRGDWSCVPVALSEAPPAPVAPPARPAPKVVCLCGSTRFREAFENANREETLAGNIVLSVGMFGHREAIDMGGPVKAMLDGLHLCKIDCADEVLVLNAVGGKCPACERFCYGAWCPDCSARVDVGPYVGESTRREIAHAEARGKPVRYLNPPA